MRNQLTYGTVWGVGWYRYRARGACFIPKAGASPLSEIGPNKNEARGLGRGVGKCMHIFGRSSNNIDGAKQQQRRQQAQSDDVKDTNEVIIDALHP